MQNATKRKKAVQVNQPVPETKETDLKSVTTISVLIGVLPAIRNLASFALPVAASFRIARILKVVTEIIETYDETRIKLASTLGTLKEDGSEYIFDDTNAPLFAEQYKELLDEPISITWELVPADKLGDLEIEPNALIPLLGVVLED